VSFRVFLLELSLGLRCQVPIRTGLAGLAGAKGIVLASIHFPGIALMPPNCSKKAMIGNLGIDMGCTIWYSGQYEIIGDFGGREGGFPMRGGVVDLGVVHGEIARNGASALFGMPKSWETAG